MDSEGVGTREGEPRWSFSGRHRRSVEKENYGMMMMIRQKREIMEVQNFMVEVKIL